MCHEKAPTFESQGSTPFVHRHKSWNRGLSSEKDEVVLREHCFGVGVRWKCWADGPLFDMSNLSELLNYGMYCYSFVQNVSYLWAVADTARVTSSNMRQRSSGDVGLKMSA